MKDERLQVRLRPGVRDRLEDLAVSTHHSAGALAGAAVEALLDYADAHGGRLVLPLNFRRKYDELRKEVERSRLSVAEESPEYSEGS